MMKDTKVLLVVMVLGFLSLAGFQFYLHMRFMNLNLLTAQAMSKKVQDVKQALPTLVPAEATQAASPSASVKGKASPSVKATVKPTEAPEATPEE